MSRLVTLAGVTASVTAHARRLGISIHTVRHRMSSKFWSPEEALTTPIRRAASREHGGEVLTVAEVMARLGVSRTGAYVRLRSDDPLRPRLAGAKHAWKGETPTVREIAEREGVSRSAISAILAGRPGTAKGSCWPSGATRWGRRSKR